MQAEPDLMFLCGEILKCLLRKNVETCDTGVFPVLGPTDRSHAPDPVHEPALLPIDLVDEPLLMDTGSYDEVGVSYLQIRKTESKTFATGNRFLFVYDHFLFPGCISRLDAAGSHHALSSPLHPSPAVVSRIPSALL